MEPVLKVNTVGHILSGFPSSSIFIPLVRIAGSGPMYSLTNHHPQKAPFSDFHDVLLRLRAIQVRFKVQDAPAIHHYTPLFDHPLSLSIRGN